MDNGRLYEEYDHWVEKVFTTYRRATLYLIQQDYQITPCQIKQDGDWILQFGKPGNHPLEEEHRAWITEFQLNEDDDI